MLRSKGYKSVVFVDDTYLQSENYSDCLDNIRDTVQLLISLGFTIHADKSVLIPTQKIIFLGFIINSKNMTITNEKKQKIKELCKYIFNTQKLNH